jgi:hypothetical protein
MMANPTPTILCQDGGSRKNKNAGDGHDCPTASQNGGTAARLFEKAERTQLFFPLMQR